VITWDRVAGGIGAGVDRDEQHTPTTLTRDEIYFESNVPVTAPSNIMEKIVVSVRVRPLNAKETLGASWDVDGATSSIAPRVRPRAPPTFPGSHHSHLLRTHSVAFRKSERRGNEAKQVTCWCGREGERGEGRGGDREREYGTGRCDV